MALKGDVDALQGDKEALKNNGETSWNLIFSNVTLEADMPP